MTWLDEKLEAKRIFEDRRDLMDTHAPVIYEDLWAGLVKIAQEAMGKGFVLNPHGSGVHRVIGQGTLNGGNHHELKFDLDGSKRRISASWRGTVISYDVDICDDGVVCLKQQGSQTPVKAAAQAIMGPFLFPELR